MSVTQELVQQGRSRLAEQADRGRKGPPPSAGPQLLRLTLFWGQLLLKQPAWHSPHAAAAAAAAAGLSVPTQGPGHTPLSSLGCARNRALTTGQRPSGVDLRTTLYPH